MPCRTLVFLALALRVSVLGVSFLKVVSGWVASLRGLVFWFWVLVGMVSFSVGGERRGF